MFAALYTPPMMYLLTKYQRRAEHPLSRVCENIIFIWFLGSSWLCADFLAAGFLFVRGASCPPSRLLSLRCSPLALGLFLPLVSFAIFVHAMRLIMARARAMYGVEMVTLPPSPPPPPKLVPAWQLGRISGLELEIRAECAKPAGPLSV
ncbi:hypothetical protein DFH08DRAFT_860303 [Mycena albidolilacea]|uniref:Uncharacterized protein n=1 Tax=Mycena albidolilacea TaxID=1033008 RepID=A0AAD7A7I6_9AGAR|nr:hypothetical protein DFH08DRAFT_860303 [Mycena albidolilacea]